MLGLRYSIMDKKIVSTSDNARDLGLDPKVWDWFVREVQSFLAKTGTINKTSTYIPPPNISETINYEFIPKGFFYEPNELCLYRIAEQELETVCGREVEVYYLRRIIGLDYSGCSTAGRAYNELNCISLFPEFILDEIQESVIPMMSGRTPTPPRPAFNDQVMNLVSLLKSKEFGSDFLQPKYNQRMQGKMIEAIKAHELRHLEIHYKKHTDNWIRAESLCFFTEMQLTPYSSFCDLFLVHTGGNVPGVFFFVTDWLSAALGVPHLSLYDAEVVSAWLHHPNSFLALPKEQLIQAIKKAEAGFLAKISGR